MFFVYVLHSLKDNKLYIGYSSDLKKRIRQHQLSNVKSTKSRLPFRLIYYEAYLLKKDAQGREKFLKGGSGHQYLHKQLKNYFQNS